MKPVIIGFAALVLFLGSFGSSAGSEQAETSGKPQRIVSLNLCVDQLLLLLADPEQISALTHLSHETSASVYRQQALNYPTTRALAEEVLPFKPDLVITGQYGNPATTNLLKKLGLRLETLPIANSMEDVLANIRHIAMMVGYPERSVPIIADMQQRLRALPAIPEKMPIAAVYDPNGYTVGTSTLRGQMIKAAGWQNGGDLLGIESYGALSLEAIVRLKPDALVESPYSTAYSRARALSLHPALRNSQIKPRIISIPSQLTICGGAWSMDIIDQLLSERLQLAKGHKNGQINEHSDMQITTASHLRQMDQTD